MRGRSCRGLTRFIRTSQQPVTSVCLLRISACAVSFYWTAWIGLDTLLPGTPLRLSFVSLCLQAVVSVGVTILLPWVNARYGDMLVFVLSQFFFVGAMAMTVCVGCGGFGQGGCLGSVCDLGPWVRLGTGLGYAILTGTRPRLRAEVFGPQLI